MVTDDAGKRVPRRVQAGPFRVVVRELPSGGDRADLFRRVKRVLRASRPSDVGTVDVDEGVRVAPSRAARLARSPLGSPRGLPTRRLFSEDDDGE